MQDNPYHKDVNSIHETNPPIFTPGGSLSAQDRSSAMWVHLSCLILYMLSLIPYIGTVIGFLIFVPPLVYYLKFKDRQDVSGRFVKQHAINCLNFQLSLIIYSILLLILFVVFAGLAFIFAGVSIDELAYMDGSDFFSYFGWVMIPFLIFILMSLFVFIYAIIGTIIAAISGSQGRMFKYWLTIPIIR